MKWLILDHVGCALGGSLTPLGLAASAVACADGGSAATVVGTRHRAGPGPAAFANAMAANALDYDDTGATGHPGATVIPAAVAGARLLGLDTEATLCALGLAGAFASLPHDGKIGWEEGRISWVKDNVAWPAEGGVRAALLAERGFRATREVLDGERGLWIMAGSDRCDFDRMVRGLGTDWDGLCVSLKPYP